MHCMLVYVVPPVRRQRWHRFEWILPRRRVHPPLITRACPPRFRRPPLRSSSPESVLGRFAAGLGLPRCLRDSAASCTSPSAIFS